MTDKKPEPTWEEVLHAKMVANAMQSSGIMAQITGQVDQAVKDGKVTIADSVVHKRMLAANAAKAMALGIEAALRTLHEEGFEIVRVEKADPVGGDGTGALPASGDGEA